MFYLIGKMYFHRNNKEQQGERKLLKAFDYLVESFTFTYMANLDPRVYKKTIDLLT